MKWRTDSFSLGNTSRKRQYRQSTEGLGKVPSSPDAAAPAVTPPMTSEKDPPASAASETQSWPRLDSGSSGNREEKRHSLPAEMATPAPSTPRSKGSESGSFDGLGKMRMGSLRRTENAPICTPTPRAKRQLISELLAPDPDDEMGGSGDDREGGAGGGAEGDLVRIGSGAILAASPALRNIISNKSSSGKNFELEAGKGGAFTSYTPEEKVRCPRCFSCCS